MPMLSSINISCDLVNFDRIHMLGFHYGTTGLDLIDQIRSMLKNSGVQVIPLRELLS